MNKRASAWTFIYGIVALLALALLFIILDQALTNNIAPYALNTTGENNAYNLTATQTAKINRTIDFWGFFPYIILLVVFIFMIYRTANKFDGGIP